MFGLTFFGTKFIIILSNSKMNSPLIWICVLSYLFYFHALVKSAEVLVNYNTQQTVTYENCFSNEAHNFRCDVSNPKVAFFTFEIVHENYPNETMSFPVFEHDNISQIISPCCLKLAFEQELCDEIIALIHDHLHNSEFAAMSKISKLEVRRWDVVKYFLDRFPFFESYLEIGCDTNAMFSICSRWFPYAVGVDPAKGGTKRMTSDDFFK